MSAEQEMTNGGEATNGEEVTNGGDKEQLFAKARDHGWTETTAFDYDQFNRTGGHDAEWHGSARVYEWKEEYGDVAPAHPELEKILFGGEHVIRKGNHYANIDLEVTTEGPVKIDPVRKVRQVNLLLIACN